MEVKLTSTLTTIPPCVSQSRVEFGVNSVMESNKKWSQIRSKIKPTTRGVKQKAIISVDIVSNQVCNQDTSSQMESVNNCCGVKSAVESS